MSRPERQQNVLDLLERLRGNEPLKQLKQLFWSELNYQRVDQPLPRRNWPESAVKALADDPVLLAGGGEDEAFHVIYCRLASDTLARGFERPVVTQLLREHPYALFVFSNKGQTHWHFLNVKYDDQTERRRLFRRITVRPGSGLRTATERVQLLDLAEIHPELFGITPLAIQQRCDAAFDVEAVTKDFFREIANWYFWALNHVTFPKPEDIRDPDAYKAQGVIRLITRLIFCWFVKEIYGCRPQYTKVRGLIRIFNRYNFTVEENTPIEQEVALDPELSGKVFENLLAAYNPETGATARKQTGSFYTPREIVNYMVDEAPIAFLKTKLEAVLPIAKDVEARLRHLFAYDDEPHRFTAPEVDALIAAIDNLKSLDPAVGSGAFPMGILHKLVFILGKLDPHNEKWKERQIARVRDTMATAEKIEDATARERAVRELEQQITGINEAFEHNELDYGRKLYLIENCIYGVDIQPIAVQIAKMRFFISLIVDQKIDDTQPNRGVRPLPNLETKFVAANTLIGIERNVRQADFITEDTAAHQKLKALREELAEARHRHFIARTPATKARCRERDRELRDKMSVLLAAAGFSAAHSRHLATWDPYDQNASANFFDAEWMFGVSEGFGITLGNPPYLSAVTMARDSETKEQFQRRYPEASGAYDIYILFILRGAQLIESNGVYCWIIPNRFLIADYAKKTKNALLEKFGLSWSVDVSTFQVFEETSSIR